MRGGPDVPEGDGRGAGDPARGAGDHRQEQEPGTCAGEQHDGMGWDGMGAGFRPLSPWHHVTLTGAARKG